MRYRLALSRELWDHLVYEEFQGEVFAVVGEVEDYVVGLDSSEFVQFSCVFIGQPDYLIQFNRLLPEGR